MTGLFKGALFAAALGMQLFLALTVAYSASPEWLNIKISEEPETTQFLIDLNSVEQGENNIAYTLRLLRSDNSFADAKLLLDCAQRKHKIAAISEFSDNGKLIARYEDSMYLLDIKGEKVFNVLLGASCEEDKARKPFIDRKDNKPEARY